MDASSQSNTTTSNEINRVSHFYGLPIDIEPDSLIFGYLNLCYKIKFNKKTVKCLQTTEFCLNKSTTEKHTNDLNINFIDFIFHLWKRKR